MTKMEGTIGPISNKLDSILEKIDDVKRVKKQKKDAMATFITNIEEDNDRKCQISHIFIIINSTLTISVDDVQKGLQIRDIASRMEFFDDV